MSNSSSTNATDVRTLSELGLEIGSLVLVSVLGIPGNLLVLCAIVVYKKIRTVANGFVFNLGIADLLVCTLVVPMLIPSRIHREWLFGDELCQTQGFFNMLGLYASLFFLAAISINRLIMMRFPKHYHNIFTPSSSFVMYLVLWGMAVSCALAPMLGWGRYKFDFIRDNCLFDRKAAPSYSIFMATVGISFPMLVCAVSYLWILAIFVKNRITLRQLSNETNTLDFSKEEVRLTKNLFIIWVIFFICWAPMTIMLFSDPKGLIARPYYIASVWFLLVNSCMNPFIYGLMNKHFRDGYMGIFILCKAKLKRNTVHVTQGSQQEMKPDQAHPALTTGPSGRVLFSNNTRTLTGDLVETGTSTLQFTIFGKRDINLNSPVKEC